MRNLPLTMSRRDVAQFLSLGVSLVAATRDERWAVELTRCAAARLQPDGRVFFAVPIPEGERTLANIERTGVIALSAALPTNYSTLQLKGSDGARVAWPEQARVSQEHRTRFIESLVAIGWPSDYAAAFWSSEFEAVAFTPDEVFDQTPGPGAGLPVLP
jgi:hypothetical protein